MLVLTRKPRESIVIGGTGSPGHEFTVTVLEIRAGKVKLGFDADPSVSVQRSEVWAQLHSGELPGNRTEACGAAAVH